MVGGNLSIYQQWDYVLEAALGPFASDARVGQSIGCVCSVCSVCRVGVVGVRGRGERVRTLPRGLCRHGKERRGSTHPDLREKREANEEKVSEASEETRVERVRRG